MYSKTWQILLLFLIISSCKNKEEEKEFPLYFENETITREAGEDCRDKTHLCTLISIETLRAEGPGEVSEKINRRLEAQIIRLLSSEEGPVEANLQELADSFIARQQKAEAEFQEEAPWKALVNASIYTQTPHIISIGVEAEVFTGGAHGYRSLSFLNFDPQTGELFGKEALFREGFRTLAESAFREKFGIPRGENINSTGFLFEEDRFQLPANIGFDGKNLILVYNSYEIASFTDGEVLLEIPYEKAKPYLTFEL